MPPCATCPGDRIRRRSRLLGLLAWPLLLAQLGCGGDAETEPGEGGGDEVVEADSTLADAEGDQGALQVFTMDDVRRRAAAGTDFPHDPHVEVDCAVCHEAPPGHGAHLLEVACADCHQASQAPMRTVAAEECQSCHHDAGQSRTCAACHGEPIPVTTVQSFALEVWDGPRTRVVDFDHEVHTTTACEGCHLEPTTREAQSCSACHEEHHVESVDCTVCHAPPGPEVHDVGAHLTCSGSGCHRERAIEEISLTRTVCLSCHVEQVDHEPEGDCVDCHQVKGEPVVVHHDGAAVHRARTRGRSP